MARGRRALRWLHLLGLGKPRPDESAALEVEHHLSELTDRLVAGGMSADEARAEAERHFGDRARYAAKMRTLEEASLRGDRWTATVNIVAPRVQERACRSMVVFGAVAIVLRLRRERRERCGP